MTISAEHRSKFAALHRLWWRINMSEKFSSGTKTPPPRKQTFDGKLIADKNHSDIFFLVIQIRELDHLNIAKVVGFCVDTLKFVVVGEYCSKGSLMVKSFNCYSVPKKHIDR